MSVSVCAHMEVSSYNGIHDIKYNTKLLHARH